MWKFAGVIFLVDIYPDSLFYASMAGLLSTLSAVLLGPWMGRFIDEHERLFVLRVTIIGQNWLVAAASAVYAVSLYHVSTLTPNQRFATFVFVTLVGMAILCFANINKVVIHKDWAVVLADGVSATQTKINATLRRVDLICSLFAPMAVGVIVAASSAWICCLTIAVWSVVSFFIEFYLSAKLMSSDLKFQQSKKNVEPKKVQRPDDASSKSYFDIIKAYVQHKCFWVSLSYCLLYLNFLTFHGVMMALVKMIGVTTLWISIGQALAGIAALASTFVVPPAILRFGLSKPGVASIWSQVFCLFPMTFCFAVLTFQEQQNNLQFYVILFFSLCTSRFGLWGFDLVETQMMQNFVDSREVGAINGMQMSLCNLMTVLSYLLTMTFPDPHNAKNPVMLSFTSLLLAAVIFTAAPKDGTDGPVNADGPVNSVDQAVFAFNENGEFVRVDGCIKEIAIQSPQIVEYDGIQRYTKGGKIFTVAADESSALA